MDRRIGASIETEFRAGGVEGRGTIQNLSEGGLFVKTHSLPDQGETVALRFQVPGRAELRLSGMVWWTTEQRTRPAGFGLRLLDANDAYADFIDSLS